MVGHSICCVQNKDKVLENVHANPSTSTDWAAHETGLSERESVWCMLHKEQLYPLYVQLLQGLQPGGSNLTSSFVFFCTKLCVLAEGNVHKGMK
jgi:hypothetical protein